MTVITRDSRGRGSKWRDEKGRWAYGPYPKEGTEVVEGRKLELPEGYREEPPEIPDYEFFRIFDIEVEVRAERT